MNVYFLDHTIRPSPSFLSMEQHRYLNVNVDNTMARTDRSVRCDKLPGRELIKHNFHKTTRHGQHLAKKVPIATVTPLDAKVTDQRQSHHTNIKSLDFSQHRGDEAKQA